tara:strand:- start:298 stop:405 length:108 start_codon:yes stop_codon:yes gene_type:complete
MNYKGEEMNKIYIGAGVLSISVVLSVLIYIIIVGI